MWRRHVTGHDQARVAAGLDGHVSWVRGLVTTQSQGLQGMRTIYAYANVDEARTVVVVKRSLSPGYAGIKNPLFDKDNTLMVFMDAKKAIEDMVSEVKEL